VPTLFFRVLAGGRVVWLCFPEESLCWSGGGALAGEGAGNLPRRPVRPRLVPRILATFSAVAGVTVGECLGDVVGADHAVAVGFADLDALFGERGFEV